ncbi:MAG TPA: sulfate permease [Gemmatimonadaceae bacterium]|nr:sulfate permease [Gemmatimonadaceae bacterium]
MFVPEIVSTLRGYTRRQLAADLQAGVIVGIVALPLAIAFAIASGVTPDRGLYTAIVAGFIISAFGGSRVQIGGPTGAFVVIVYGVVQKYGVDGLMVATLMAGVILIALGAARLGGAIKFVPHPVVIGFTSGIAVVIFSSQVKDVLGLRMGAVPAPFVEKWASYVAHLGSANWYAVGIAAAALLIMQLWPFVSHRVPGPFVALVATTVAVHMLDLPVETIGSRFGAISAHLPQPVMPRLSFTEITSLVQPAIAIALLGAVESLLSAVVADGMIGTRHKSNLELVAQGAANVVAPLFGGIPATGAIARTATNVRNGGRTPVAGITHAVTLLLLTLFLGRLAALIPMATLGAILVIVAYNMSEWRTFRSELRGPKSDVIVLLTTFFLTVVVDLTVAIEVGMVLSAFLFMRRMAEVTNVTAITREHADGTSVDDEDVAALARQLPKGVVVYEINGPLFFGAAERFRNVLGEIRERPRALVVRMRHVPAMDSTGIHALRELVRRSMHDRTTVILCEVSDQPRIVLTSSGLFDELGPDNVLPSFDEAMARAAEIARHARGTTGTHEVSARVGH